MEKKSMSGSDMKAREKYQLDGVKAKKTSP